jgi:hypothetical protein
MSFKLFSAVVSTLSPPAWDCFVYIWLFQMEIINKMKKSAAYRRYEVNLLTQFYLLIALNNLTVFVFTHPQSNGFLVVVNFSSFEYALNSPKFNGLASFSTLFKLEIEYQNQAYNHLLLAHIYTSKMHSGLCF